MGLMHIRGNKEIIILPFVDDSVMYREWDTLVHSRCNVRKFRWTEDCLLLYPEPNDSIRNVTCYIIKGKYNTALKEFYPTQINMDRFEVLYPKGDISTLYALKFYKK